jgi:hypothetical protein
MEIVEIPLITQNIYESFIPDIDNIALVTELNTYYTNVTSKLKDIYDWDMSFPAAGPESEKLKDEISKRVDAVAGKPMVCREIWMYTMSKLMTMPQHNHKTNYQLHPEEYYSIAYYAHAPEDGANLHFVAEYCNGMENRIVVPAVTGKLIIFNSFLDHYTDRHLSDENRMCISGNYKPETPDKTMVPDWSTYIKPKDKNVPLTRFS